MCFIAYVICAAAAIVVAAAVVVACLFFFFSLVRSLHLYATVYVCSIMCWTYLLFYFFDYIPYYHLRFAGFVLANRFSLLMLCFLYVTLVALLHSFKLNLIAFVQLRHFHPSFRVLAI